MELPLQRTSSAPCSNFWIGALVGVFFLSLYVLTMGGHTSSSDEETIYYVTKSLADHGGFEASGYPETPPLNGMRGTDGQFYGHTGILPSIMAVPFYLLGDLLSHGFGPEFQPYVTRLFVGMRDPVVTALTCWLVFMFCVRLEYSARVSVAVTMAFGLASIAWPYSKYCWSEPVTAWWLLLSVYAAFMAVRQKAATYCVVSGLSLGLAAASKMTTLAVFPGLFAYLLLAHRGERRGWSLVLFSAALLLPLAGVGWANHSRFGGIFKAGYDEWAGPSPVQLAHYRGIFGLLISPGKSVFLYSPVMAAAVLAFGWFWSKFRSEALLFAFTFLVHVVLAGLFIHWHGDSAWGPRYLVPVTSFLVIPIGAALVWAEGVWKKGAWFLFQAAFAAGVLVNVGAVLVNYGTYVSRSGGPFGALAEQRRWLPARSPILAHWALAARRLDKTLHSKSPEAVFESGFYPTENRKGTLYPRWTDGNATIKTPLKGARKLRFTVRFWDKREGAAGPTQAELTYNGVKCANSELTIDSTTAVICITALVDVSPSDGRFASLGIRSNTWSPSDQPGSDDRRRLGVFLKDIRVQLDDKEISAGVPFVRNLPVSKDQPWSGDAFAWFYQPETELYHPVSGWGFDVWSWHLYHSGLPCGLLWLALAPFATLILSAVLLFRCLPSARATEQSGTPPAN
jgi:hypothetical protein